MKKILLTVALYTLTILTTEGSVAGVVFEDDFSGTTLDLTKWEIYDAHTCTPHGSMIQDDELVIILPDNNNNCGAMGVYSRMTFGDYTDDISYEVDFHTTLLHNWQDSPLFFLTAIGGFVYDNSGGWNAAWRRSSTEYGGTYFDTSPLTEQTYRLKVEVAGGVLKFWRGADGGTYTLVHSVDAGEFVLYDDTRLKLKQSDRGPSYYDNVVVRSSGHWIRHDVASNFTTAVGVAVGDFNGDGYVDIAGSDHSPEKITWWASDGQSPPGFAYQGIIGSPGGLQEIFAIDVDKNGTVDILSAADEADDVTWWDNDGHGNFTQRIIDGSFDTRTVYACDVDNDNDNDVISGSRTGIVYWYRNDGGGNFTKLPVGNSNGYVTMVHAADFDGDDHLEILVSDSRSHCICWWKNNGAESFSVQPLIADVNSAYAAYAVDLDGDQDVDILGASYTDAYVAWWENDGNDNFPPTGKHTIHAGFNGAFRAMAVDIDGDDVLDVVASASETGEILWWNNDGHGNFSPPNGYVIDAQFSEARRLWTEDMDDDGITDVLCAGSNCITWWRNPSAGGGPEYVVHGSVETGSVPLRHATVYVDGSLATGEDYVGMEITDEGGQFSVQLPPGNYAFTPQKYEHTFHPPSMSINLPNDDPVSLGFEYDPPSREVDRMLLRSWEWFKSQFIDGNHGRVDYGDISTEGKSEGQGYGLLMATIMRDQPAFDLIWEWTQDNLQHCRNGTGSSYLFSWHWKNGSVEGPNSATDGDVDIATALMLASYQEGWLAPDYYLNEAKKIIKDIWDNEVAKNRLVKSAIGQEESFFVLTNGDWADVNSSTATIETNPSYYATYAFKLFSAIDDLPGHGDRDWIELAEDCYELVDAMTKDPLNDVRCDDPEECQDYENPCNVYAPYLNILIEGALPPYWVHIDGAGNLSARMTEDGFERTPDGLYFCRKGPVSGQLYQHDSFRTFWRLALDYIWFEEQRSVEYMTKYQTLVAEWKNDRELLDYSVHRHDGTVVEDMAWTDEPFYAGALGQFLVYDQEYNETYAADLFDSVFKLADNETHWKGPYQGHPDIPFYHNAWCWLAAALYSGAIVKPPIDAQNSSHPLPIDEMSFVLMCPADLIISDPEGYVISKDQIEVTDCVYSDQPYQDGQDTYVLVRIAQPKQGIYNIQVIPKPEADPNSTFSLYSSFRPSKDTLAYEVRMIDIAQTGYCYSTLDTGSIHGLVSASSCGLLGVPVDVYDKHGNVIASATADESGRYGFAGLNNGSYFVSISTPLGFEADEETKELEVKGLPHELNFELTELEVTPRQRSRGYWAHQLWRAFMNWPKDYTLVDFSQLASLINEHFNQNQINPVDFYSVPQPADQSDSLLVLKKLLHMRNTGESEPFLKRLAKAQLMALMLNVVSGKLSQTHEISADGRTISQAITYCDMLVNDEIDPPGGGCRYIRASLILVLANWGLTVPGGMIPEDIIEIAYRVHNPDSAPTGFSLSQNYPNPFNPSCEIRYELPTDAVVNLFIYNVLGQKIKTLVNEYQAAGHKTVSWDGTDEHGNKAASGIYFYRIEVGECTETKKMILIK